MDICIYQFPRSDRVSFYSSRGLRQHRLGGRAGHEAHPAVVRDLQRVAKAVVLFCEREKQQQVKIFRVESPS